MRAARLTHREGVFGRRGLLRAGALSVLGFGLPHLWRGRAAAAGERPAGSFGRARSCILLFMTGGPSHIDTWDLKPDAPAEIRGEFSRIATSVPGVHIGEHFPRLARLAHRFAIVRSLSHGDPNHPTAPHELLTGRSAPAGGPADTQQWPTYGAVLARLGRGGPELPAFVRLRPFIAGGPEILSLQSQGAGAGWLGQRFAPLSLEGDLLDPQFRSEDLMLQEDVAPQRFLARRALLDVIGSRTGHLRHSAAGLASDDMFQRACQLLGSSRARAAFDVAQEPERTRDEYGRNLHGHCVLLARRLIEAGVPLVTVFYQNDLVGGEDSTGWDTHGGNFPLLKQQLMPTADAALSALLVDLDSRGLLEETLVVWVGEFGRAPRISKPGAGTTGLVGRDHWPQCFSCVLAGGGIRGGQVYGSSDRTGAYPTTQPVSPADLAATIYHCLGVDSQTAIVDDLDRPVHLCEGTPIRGVLV